MNCKLFQQFSHFLKTALVFGPTNPSTTKPLSVWNLLMALCVSGPNKPSTTTAAPFLFKAS